IRTMGIIDSINEGKVLFHEHVLHLPTMQQFFLNLNQILNVVHYHISEDPNTTYKHLQLNYTVHNVLASCQDHQYVVNLRYSLNIPLERLNRHITQHRNGLELVSCKML